MATCRDTPDADGRGTDGRGQPDRPPEPLDSRLVTNSDGPDRRTLFPRELSRVARMSTWITANEAVFVDLEANR